MVSLTVFLLYIVFLLLVTVAKSSLICEELNTGPTTLELLLYNLPDKLTTKLLELVPLSSEVWKYQIPLLSWMSDLVYVVTFPISETISYKELYILQENHSKFNFLCNQFGNYQVLNYFCSCPYNQQLVKSPKFSNFQSLSSFPFDDSWCIRKAYCYKSDKRANDCTVHVDPFRKSCLYIDDEKSNKQVSIDYFRDYPKLTRLLPANWNSTNPEVEGFFSEGTQDEMSEFFYQLLDKIPFYPFLFILGFFMIINAEEIAETTACQLIFESFIGISFALVVLFFLAQQVLSKILNRYNDSFMRFIHFPIIFSTFSFIWYNPSSLAILRDLVFEFW
jgi:hypothetical protein